MNFHSLYRTLDRVPLGGRVASAALQVAAPYFLTIPAVLTSLEPGRGTARMRHLPWVRNHLGTVHAISLCNLTEFTMGAVAEATGRPTHRWVPRGMQVRYERLARGTMHATATLELPDPLADKQEVPVTVLVTDDAGEQVFSAAIDIWVTARRS